MTFAPGKPPAEGPWFVREEPDREGLAVIEDGRSDGLFSIRCEWSEAHLVAAAPDLLAALRSFVDWYGEVGAHGLLPIADQPSAFVRAGMAAIDRAEGRTP